MSSMFPSSSGLCDNFYSSTILLSSLQHGRQSGSKRALILHFLFQIDLGIWVFCASGYILGLFSWYCEDYHLYFNIDCIKSVTALNSVSILMMLISSPRAWDGFLTAHACAYVWTVMLMCVCVHMHVFVCLHFLFSFLHQFAFKEFLLTLL